MAEKTHGKVSERDHPNCCEPEPPPLRIYGTVGVSTECCIADGLQESEFTVDGVRFLFTGDANGKERDETSPGIPGHVEEALLAVEANHLGTLTANV